MISIWIDPSTTNIWIAVIDDSDNYPLYLWTLKSKLKDKQDRLIAMMSSLEDLLNNKISDIIWPKDKVNIYIEYPAMSKSARSSMIVAESLWRIKKTVFSIWFHSINEVNVMEVKQLIWKKDKKDIFAWAKKIFEISWRIIPETDHEADAYLIAVAWKNKFTNRNIELWTK